MNLLLSLIPLFLATGGILSLRCAAARPLQARIIGWGTWGTACLFAATATLPMVGELLSGSAVVPEPAFTHSLLRADSLSWAAVTVALVAYLMGRLGGVSERGASTTQWNAGLLALCGMATHPALWWLSVQLILVPQLWSRSSAVPAEETSERTASERAAFLHPAVVGSLLLAAGSLLFFLDFRATLPTGIGLILIICGLGGVLDWFPFPRLASPADQFRGGDASGADRGSSWLTGRLRKRPPDRVDVNPPAARTVDPSSPDVSWRSNACDDLGQWLLPVIIGGVFLYRSVRMQPLTDSELMLLAVPAVFSLVVTAARLTREERFSRRFRLATLGIFGNVVLVVCLAGWEASHTERVWHAVSNVPTATQLLLRLLFTETTALLTVLFGYRILAYGAPGEDYADVLAGAIQRRPWTALMTLTGVLSLAGFPPFPGCWWRFHLVMACMLPHRRSTLTGLTEPDVGFASLAVAVVVVWILLTIGHLRLCQWLLFEEPLRPRSGQASPMLWLGAALSFTMLWVSLYFPLA